MSRDNTNGDTNDDTNGGKPVSGVLVVTDEIMTDPEYEALQLALLALMPPANELPI